MCWTTVRGLVSGDYGDNDREPTFDGEGLLDLRCTSAMKMEERMRERLYLLGIVCLIGVDSVERHFAISGDCM